MADIPRRPLPPCPPPIPRDPWHAIVRAKERYGLTLTGGELRDMAKRIERGHPRAVREVVRQGERKVVVLVLWRDAWRLVVFDTWGRVVVTFLPLGMEFTDDGRAILPHIDGGEGPEDWREKVRAERAALSSPEKGYRVRL